MLIGLILSFGASLAMLSKPLDPNSRRYAYWAESRNHSNVIAVTEPYMDQGVNVDEIRVMLQNGVTEEKVHELLDSVSKALTAATAGTSASKKAVEFGNLMTKLADSFEVFKLIDLETKESFEKTRNRVCFVLGLTVDKVFDIILDLIVEMRSKKFLIHLMSCHFLRYLFGALYRSSEKDIPALYWTLVFYCDLFQAQYNEQSDTELKQFWKAMYDPVPQFIDFFKQIFRKTPEFVPEEERLKRFPIVDWRGLLQIVLKMPKVTKKAVDILLLSNKYQFKNTKKTMIQINKDFDLHIKQIAARMDEQFPTQKPEDFISETPSIVAISEEIEKKANNLLHSQIEETDVEKLSNSSSDSSSNLKISVNHERIEKKTAKIEARRLKEQEKHHNRLKHIQLIEKDDDDVAFYYSAKNSDSNLVFLRNQKEQMCRRTFEASARFEHSLFPGLTASGTTMNYLCSLMVSGNPDYEGFVSAHKDLGGIFVEKKNGNKLFLFMEPISYHKTLHAPHQSSRFDHVLYRRFYRNCGLHPFFFVTS